jgi:predicted deacetylase
VPPERRPSSGPHTLAVALHDIEPATFERCAGIREWLQERGVDRVTLLVIPARDLHPLGERSPELVQWLLERRRLGDSIAQHGFQHEQLRRARWPHRLLSPTRTARGAEFAGLDSRETRRAVEAGWRLMKLAGIEPDGFVAPAYAYTPALRDALGARFRWWASLMGLHGALASGQAAGREQRWSRLAPAWSIGTEGAFERALSPTMIRAGALLARGPLRLDVHPSDLRHPRHRNALERVIAHSTRQRTVVTYNELASAGPPAPEPVPVGVRVLAG